MRFVHCVFIGFLAFEGDSWFSALYPLWVFKPIFSSLSLYSICTFLFLFTFSLSRDFRITIGFVEEVKVEEREGR
ncbi:hypothetical protein Hdeb2414_s0121g00803391 [Helianthus debilis subsp. tardiflorus]